jgi:hypothetical protein
LAGLEAIAAIMPTGRAFVLLEKRWSDVGEIDDRVDNGRTDSGKFGRNLGEGWLLAEAHSDDRL